MNTRMQKILVLIGIVISSIFSYSQEDISYDYPYKPHNTNKSDEKVSITTSEGQEREVEYYGSAEGSKDTLFHRKYTNYTEDGLPHPDAKEIKQKWHENPNWWCYELFGTSDEYYEGKIDSLGSVIDYYHENFYDLHNLDVKSVINNFDGLSTLMKHCEDTVELAFGQQPDSEKSIIIDRLIKNKLIRLGPSKQKYLDYKRWYEKKSENEEYKDTNLDSLYASLDDEKKKSHLKDTALIRFYETYKFTSKLDKFGRSEYLAFSEDQADVLIQLRKEDVDANVMKIYPLVGKDKSASDGILYGFGLYDITKWLLIVLCSIIIIATIYNMYNNKTTLKSLAIKGIGLLIISIVSFQISDGSITEEDYEKLNKQILTKQDPNQSLSDQATMVYPTNESSIAGSVIKLNIEDQYSGLAKELYPDTWDSSVKSLAITNKLGATGLWAFYLLAMLIVAVIIGSELRKIIIKRL